MEKIDIIVVDIIFVLVFLTYNITMSKVHGKLWSVSQGYYRLKEDGEGRLFTFFLLVIVAYLMTLAAINDSWIFFASGIGAGFTGVAARYKDEGTDWVHYSGSGAMVTLASIGIGVSYGNWWVIIGIIISSIIILVMYKYKRKAAEFGIEITNPLYWIEQVAFVFVVLGTVPY